MVGSAALIAQERMVLREEAQHLEDVSAAHIASINEEFAANQAQLNQTAHVFQGQYDQARDNWATEVHLVRSHYEGEAKESSRVCTTAIHAEMQRVRDHSR